jgi:hypothetical protein
METISNNKNLSFIKDNLINLFKNEDIKRNMREIVKPIGILIYNELFIYIWFICIYNVVLFFIIIFVLILLLRKSYTSQ